MCLTSPRSGGDTWALRMSDPSEGQIGGSFAVVSSLCCPSTPSASPWGPAPASPVGLPRRGSADGVGSAPVSPDGSSASVSGSRGPGSARPAVSVVACVLSAAGTPARPAMAAWRCAASRVWASVGFCGCGAVGSSPWRGALVGASVFGNGCVRQRLGRDRARGQGADGWYGCCRSGRRATVPVGFWVGSRWGEGVMPRRNPRLVSRGCIPHQALGGLWLEVRVAEGFLRPCAGIGLCCRRRPVLSATSLGGRCRTAPVPGRCTLWCCSAGVRVRLWYSWLTLRRLLGGTFLPGARWVGP